MKSEINKIRRIAKKIENKTIKRLVCGLMNVADFESDCDFFTVHCASEEFKNETLEFSIVDKGLVLLWVSLWNSGNLSFEIQLSEDSVDVYGSLKGRNLTADGVSRCLKSINELFNF